MQPAAIPVAEAMLAYEKRDYRTAIEKLTASRYRWPLVGASHAQRDLFAILLIASAEKAGDWHARARAVARTHGTAPAQRRQPGALPGGHGGAAAVSRAAEPGSGFPITTIAC